MSAHPPRDLGKINPHERVNLMASNADAMLPVYNDLASRVAELDEILDAGLDTKSAGRRAVVNSLVKEQEARVDEAVKSFIEQLANADDAVKYGFYFGFVRGLRAEYEEAGQAYADSQVAERPQVQVDPAQLEIANKERSDKVTMMKNLFEIIKVLDPEEAEKLDKVPRRRSLGGPKGKRAISYYTWNVDGEDFDGTLGEVAKSLGYDKAVELRSEMKESGINLTTPPATINFTTPSGHVIVGTRDADAPENEPEEPDTDEADENEDEEETETVGV
jgi:hypothetical protein